MTALWIFLLFRLLFWSVVQIKVFSIRQSWHNLTVFICMRGHLPSWTMWFWRGLHSPSAPKCGEIKTSLVVCVSLLERSGCEGDVLLSILAVSKKMSMDWHLPSSTHSFFARQLQPGPGVWFVVEPITFSLWNLMILLMLGMVLKLILIKFLLKDLLNSKILGKWRSTMERNLLALLVPVRH